MDIEIKHYKSSAKELLKYFGNDNPTVEQVEKMTSILFNTWLRKTIVFDKGLTAREKICLYLASQGNSAEETAQVLGITERTVRSHRKEIMRKLFCKNITQAVSLGIKYGYVQLTEQT